MPVSQLIHFLFAVSISLGISDCIAESKNPSSGPRTSVAEVADQRIVVTTEQGTGILPVYASHGIDTAATDVRRVLLIIHGALRNAGVYFASGQEAVKRAGKAGAGTLVVAPQFLARRDLRSFRLAPDVLAWTANGWTAGEPAHSPASISSFAAVDAVLGHFADRKLYPALTQVVIAGHSAGAQFVQRYAVAGHGDAVLRKVGIGVRYVVANPSSYLYFSNERPAGQVALRPADSPSCPQTVEWKYGLKNAPPYVAKQNAADLEQRYARRDVTYLLGMADTNPYTHFIDRSCAAMAQGPDRLARGLAYFNYMQGRHTHDLKQDLIEVPGVGHDGRGMFTSDCGLAILFGTKVPEACPRKP